MRHLLVAAAAALLASEGCATSLEAEDGKLLDSNQLDPGVVVPDDAPEGGSTDPTDPRHHGDVLVEWDAGDNSVADLATSKDAGVAADAAGDVPDASALWKVIPATCSGVLIPAAPPAADYEGLLPIVYGNGCSSYAKWRPATSDASPLEAHVPQEGLLGGLLVGWYFSLSDGGISAASWTEGPGSDVQQYCYSVWPFGDFPPWFVMLGPGPGFDYRDGHFFAADGTYCTSGVGVRWSRLQRDLPCPTSFPEEIYKGVEVGGTYPCGPAVQALAALSKDDVLILWRRKPFLPTREIVKFTFGVAEPTPWTFESFPEGHRLTDMKRGHDDLIYLGFIDADWTKHRGHVRSYTHDGKLVSISPTVPGWVAGVSAAKNGDIYAGTNHGPIFWIRKSDGQVVPLSGTYCTETFTGAIDVIEVAP